MKQFRLVRSELNVSVCGSALYSAWLPRHIFIPMVPSTKSLFFRDVLYGIALRQCQCQCHWPLYGSGGAGLKLVLLVSGFFSVGWESVCFFSSFRGSGGWDFTLDSSGVGILKLSVDAPDSIATGSFFSAADSFFIGGGINSDSANKKNHYLLIYMHSRIDCWAAQKGSKTRTMVSDLYSRTVVRHPLNPATNYLNDRPNNQLTNLLYVIT